MFFGVKKNKKLSQIVPMRTSNFFPLSIDSSQYAFCKGIFVPEARPKNQGWDYSGADSVVAVFSGCIFLLFFITRNSSVFSLLKTLSWRTLKTRID